MEISIEIAKKENLNEIIQIADTQLGNGYLNNILNQNTQSYLLVAKNKSSIVGFSLSLIYESEVLIKSIAVKSDFQNKGVAISLFRQTIEFAKANNYKTIKSIAWKSKNGIQLQGLLNKFNFHQIKELPNYWKKDSLAKNYSCPDCGSPPCLCTAVFFEKLL